MRNEDNKSFSPYYLLSLIAVVYAKFFVPSQVKHKQWQTIILNLNNSLSIKKNAQ